MSERKPDPAAAMAALLEQLRNHFPFELPPDQLCNGPCTGCPKKLLEFLDTEIEDWAVKLRHGVAPTLGDISRLARRGHKIHAVLARNGLVNKPTDHKEDKTSEI